MATRAILTELATLHQARHGSIVEVESVGGVDAARRVAAGEAFDVVILSSASLDPLAKLGHVLPDTVRPMARSGVAVAVKAGAACPDIGSEAALRDAVMSARSVGYSTGPSGTHLQGWFERWGIAEALKPRIVQAPPGVPVGSLVARGDVALGFQQLSELIHCPGIQVVGPLPDAVQTLTVFAAGVASTRAHHAEALTWIDFLTSADAAATMRQHGMEPA